MYLHELHEWPNFRWDDARLKPLLDTAAKLRAQLFLDLNELGFDDRGKASLTMLTQEVVKTSEIEGQILDPEEVRSSVARRLGLDIGGLRKDEARNRNVEGIVQVVLNATTEYKDPLDADRLYRWHGALFPTGYNELGPILVGQWRNQPLQVVSSSLHRQKVHYEAPDPLRLPEEMDRFLKWFEGANIDSFVKAGVAHLYFITIHPFDDGNGRIARAIADLAMARADKMDQRFYSMSAQIRADRKEYYDILEATQKGTLDITDWLDWFLNCLIRSLNWAQEALRGVLRKVRVWRSLKQLPVNDRQADMMNRLLDGVFMGNLNAPKYAKIEKCSPDTASRDLAELLDWGFLDRSGKGKATKYELKENL